MLGEVAEYTDAPTRWELIRIVVDMVEVQNNWIDFTTLNALSTQLSDELSPFTQSPSFHPSIIVRSIRTKMFPLPSFIAFTGLCQDLSNSMP